MRDDDTVLFGSLERSPHVHLQEVSTICQMKEAPLPHSWPPLEARSGAPAGYAPAVCPRSWLVPQFLRLHVLHTVQRRPDTQLPAGILA